MRIDQCDSRQPTVVGNTPDTDASVILRHVFDKPVDRVVRIGALVGRLRIPLIARRTVHQKVALGIVAATNILKHENIIFLNELRISTRAPGLRSLYTVGRPFKKYRGGTGLMFGRKNNGKELYSIAHRDQGLGPLVRNPRVRLWCISGPSCFDLAAALAP